MIPDRNQNRSSVRSLAIRVAAFSLTLPFGPQAVFPDRDKTGTTGAPTNAEGPQPLQNKGSAGRGSFQAERGGFEPPVSFTPRRFSRPVHSATLPPLRRCRNPVRNGTSDEPHKRVLHAPTHQNGLHKPSHKLFAASHDSQARVYRICPLPQVLNSVRVAVTRPDRL